MDFASLSTQAVQVLGGMGVFTVVTIAAGIFLANKYPNKEEHKGIHQVLAEENTTRKKAK